MSGQVLVTQESQVSRLSLRCHVKLNYPVSFSGFLTVRNRNRIVESGRISDRKRIQPDIQYIPINVAIFAKELESKCSANCTSSLSYWRWTTDIKGAMPLPSEVWLWWRKDEAGPLVRVSASFPSVLRHLMAGRTPTHTVCKTHFNLQRMAYRKGGVGVCKGKPADKGSSG